MTTKKRGLLHQSFYKQKVQGQFTSIMYGHQYFQQHQITSLLRGAIKHITKNGILPQNPYSCLIRLLTINSVEDSLTTYFHNKSIQPLALHSKNRKNNIEEVRIGQLSLYTSHQLASQIDPKLMNNLESIVKSNRVNLGNLDVHTAVCGTELLKSNSLNYTSYSKNTIVLRNYIELGTKESGAADKFSKAVYNAIQQIMNSKYSHFQHLGFESFYALYHSEEIWNRSQIILYKTKLINHLCTLPFEAKELYVKYYKKYNGEYFEIRQKFIPILEIDGKAECPEALPLESYFKGGFTTREGAEVYVNIHSDESRGDLNKLFLDENSYWINWYYHQQDIEELTWSLYYHIMAQRNDKAGLLADTLSSLLCSPISQISHYTTQLKTLIALLDLKVSKKDIQSMMGQIWQGIRQNLNQGYNAELYSIKDYLLKLCQICSSHSYFNNSKQRTPQSQSELDLTQILTKIKMILDGVIHNYKQHLIGFNKSFTQFISEVFEQIKDSPLKQFTITSFSNFFEKKKKSKVVMVQEEINKVVQQFQVNQDHAADIILINYYQETKLKQNVYNFLLEICFEFKPLYPLPILIVRLIEYLFEYTYKELVINNVKIFQKVKVLPITDKIEEAIVENINVYSLKGNLIHYAYSFVKIYRYFDLFKFEEKGVNAIYSVSKKSLMEDLGSVNINQNTLSLDIDILIKTPLQEALEVFYKVINQKLRELEKNKTVGVIGYFYKNILLKAFDLKTTLTLQEFKTVIASSKSVLVKCLIKQNRIKLVELTFNLHYFNSQGWRHLKQIDRFWEYNRVFFERKHLETWVELYPGALSYSYKGSESTDILDINLAIKKWLIQAGKDKVEKPYILQYYSERLHQLSQQSMNYSYMIQYSKTDRTGKFQLNNMKASFQEYFRSIRKLITEYDYTYLQGLAISVDQYIKLINDYLQLHQNNNGQETELLWLQQHFVKISNFLTCSSEIIILFYRNYLKFEKESSFIY